MTQDDPEAVGNCGKKGSPLTSTQHLMSLGPGQKPGILSPAPVQVEMLRQVPLKSPTWQESVPGGPGEAGTEGAKVGVQH